MILLAPFLMMACAGPEPAETPGFRTEGAPIYSSAVLEPARLAGSWAQVATFAPGRQAGCAPGNVEIEDGRVRWQLCLAGGEATGVSTLQPGKAGRFAVAGMAEWWVLWADADYRTLVVGTPSGEFGFVLNREATLPPDRLQAVRDILRFNGYRTEDLHIF